MISTSPKSGPTSAELPQATNQMHHRRRLVNFQQSSNHEESTCRKRWVVSCDSMDVHHMLSTNKGYKQHQSQPRHRCRRYKNQNLAPPCPRPMVNESPVDLNAVHRVTSDSGHTHTHTHAAPTPPHSSRVHRKDVGKICAAGAGSSANTSHCLMVNLDHPGLWRICYCQLASRGGCGKRSNKRLQPHSAAASELAATLPFNFTCIFSMIGLVDS